jgi:hypothetical protein
MPKIGLLHQGLGENSRLIRTDVGQFLTDPTLNTTIAAIHQLARSSQLIALAEGVPGVVSVSDEMIAADAI